MNPILKLTFKIIVLGLPLILSLVAYAIYDPYMVLRPYESYDDTQDIELNRDYVSTEVFLRNYDKQKYDSFIFGNSRTIAFSAKEWSKHIGSPAVFHYDASAESIYGIHGKFKLLDGKGVSIKNALVLMDSSVLKNADDNSEHLLRKHPAVSGHSALYFQGVFGKAFLSPTFAAPYLARKAVGRKVEWLGDPFRETAIHVDPVTNDLGATDRERQIVENPESYYNAKKMGVFYDRTGVANTPFPAVIKAEQIRLLEEMQAILAKHKTDLRIVIAPNYDQRPLHSNDLAALRRIFGEQHVYDYSGVNEFTADYRNYYEESHFRPQVGSAIMKLIYKTKMPAEPGKTGE